MPQYKFLDSPVQYKLLDTPPEDVPQPESVELQSHEESPKPVGFVPPKSPTKDLLIGAGETAISMGTGFLGALPGFAVGMFEAIKNKDIASYEDAFKFTQQFYTYEPRSKEGKAIQKLIGNIFEKYSEMVDKHIVDPNLTDHNNVLMATIGKTSGEALPLLLPFLTGGKGKPGAPQGPDTWGQGKGTGEGTTESPEAPAGPSMATPESPVPNRPAITDGGRPVQGEYIPKDEVALREQNARLGQKPEAPIEGEVARPELLHDPKLLPAPEEVTTPTYKLIPENNVVDLSLERAKKGTIAEWFSEKDIDEVILEDPYKKGGALESGDIVQFDPKQRGMVDYTVFTDALSKTVDAIDESNAMKEWRKYARPLQAGDPLVAGRVKDFANMKRVHSKERTDSLALLDQFSKESRETMIRAIEDPTLREKLSPELNIVLDKLVHDNEMLSQEALDLGIIGNVRKPYAPHIVKQFATGPWSDMLRKQGYLKTKVRPSGTRKYSTFEEGEAAGVEYIKDIKAMVDINYQLKEAIIGRHFVNYIKQWKIPSGEELVGFPGQDIPGYKTINHPAFQDMKVVARDYIKYKGKNHYVKDDVVMIDGKPYPIHNKSTYIDGTRYNTQTLNTMRSLQIKVHPDIAAPLEAVLLADNPSVLTKSLNRIKAATIGIIMYNPMFHNFTVASKIVPTLPGAGFGKHIWNPEAVLGKEVYENLNPAQKALSRTWVSDYVVGNYLNAKTENIVDALKHNVVPLGGRGYRADLYGDLEPMRKNILQNFSATESLGKGVEKLGDFWHGYLLWDRIADAQMGLYNRYTIEFTNRGIKQFIKEQGRSPNEKEVNTLREDAKYLAGEFSNTIVGVFGKEDFGAEWRHFLNNVLFSRSYTMSNVRLAEYGMGVMPKHLVGQMRLMEPKTSMKVFTGYAYMVILKDLFLMLGTLYGLNYAFTKYNNIPDKDGKYGGHFPSKNEPGKELYIAVDTKDDGTVVYSGIPFRAARDIFEMVAKPTTLWYNKLNPSLKATYEVLANKDWKGKDIRLEGSSAPEAILHSAEHLAKGITGWETTFNTFNPDDDSWRNRYRLLGLQISKGADGGMVAGNIKSIMREQQAQKDMVMADAVDLMKRKKESEAIDLLLDNNLFGEIKGFTKRSSDPYAYLLQTINIKDLYQKATPKQKEELDKIEW